jgi:hypothetical protein
VDPHVPPPQTPSPGPQPGPFPQGPAPPTSLQLQYATPGPPKRWPSGPDAPVLRVLRQIVFAVGLALLMFGLTSAWAGVYQRDAPYYAGWGAGFIGLATPLWRVRKDEE